ncbi:MAG: polyphosphate kinase 2 family protein [Cellulomonadaceae bacterium]|nr:polyphosphate kinase 2 family protein [Cellulomonadaceae bacterium]
MKNPWDVPAREALRVGHHTDLTSFDCSSTPGWDGDKDDAETRTTERGEVMSELQERLFAHGRSDGTRSILLVLQGMDTSGKGGIVRHVLGMVDPQGVALRSFGVPTDEERKHDYLWRIRNALPRPGYIGVFDRSHYEDVLVVRVNELVPRDVWEARYAEINAFEAEVAASGTTVIKVALMVSQEEQAARLRERLERPDKHWKYNPGDLDVRRQWPAYREAYEAVLDRTSTDVAPWYLVPADKKWYARLAVTELLTGALEDLDLQWPAADFDVEAELARLDSMS